MLLAAVSSLAVAAGALLWFSGRAVAGMVGFGLGCVGELAMIYIGLRRPG
jgi:hypothetical protein